MKNILFILTLLLLVNPVFSQDCDWVISKDIERGFRLEFPQKPTFESQNVSTAVGAVAMDMYMLDLSASMSGDNLLYMIAYTAYPEGDYSDESMQQSMLDGSVSGAVSNVNGQLLSTENITFNGFKGRMAKISISNGAYIIWLKNILVDNKLYLLQVITDKSKDSSDNKSRQRFYDSFELIKTN